MRNVSGKVTQKSKHTILCSIFFPPKIVPSKTWCGIQYGRAGHATEVIILRMRFACRTNKAIDTHSEYVILFNAFRRQGPLRESASLLLRTHFAYLQLNIIVYTSLIINDTRTSSTCLCLTNGTIHTPLLITLFSIVPCTLLYWADSSKPTHSRAERSISQALIAARCCQ